MRVQLLSRYYNDNDDDDADMCKKELSKEVTDV